ncbi:uncharacterized protein LOC118458472 [Anopheles albimanus]|uniref:MADF domain-containing protein n=1 Tax=Anopheles albimanus TaxID=7167 RepID=A0A182FL10_ANOAL|nr:uncharacterized protein LOC118458472 [Anopheles albimanus]
MDQISKNLVARVRSYPVLYDRSHNMYNDVVKKEKTWKLIASEMNIESICAKQKWKSLRDNYLRYLKQKSNAKAPMYREWKQEEKWKPMQFLQSYVQPKEGFPREASRSDSPTAPTGTTGVQQEPNTNSDATELLFRSFAKSVRNIRCPVRQAKVKLQIMEIITNATIAIDPHGLRDSAFKYL